MHILFFFFFFRYKFWIKKMTWTICNFISRNCKLNLFHQIFHATLCYIPWCQQYNFIYFLCDDTQLNLDLISSFFFFFCLSINNKIQIIKNTKHSNFNIWKWLNKLINILSEWSEPSACLSLFTASSHQGEPLIYDIDDKHRIPHLVA